MLIAFVVTSCIVKYRQKNRNGCPLLYCISHIINVYRFFDVRELRMLISAVVFIDS